MYFTYFAVTRWLSQESEEFGVPKYNVIFLHVTKQQFGCKLSYSSYKVGEARRRQNKVKFKLKLKLN